MDISIKLIETVEEDRQHTSKQNGERADVDNGTPLDARVIYGFRRKALDPEHDGGHHRHNQQADHRDPD